jgi:type IV pilus biogenesis protein CpaD/CtpE
MKKHFLPLIALSLFTSACNGSALFRPSLYDETVVTQRPIEIHETRYVDKKPTKEVNHDYLMGLVNDYDHHGNSPLYVVLAYDPEARNGKLTTFNKASILKGQLAKLDITNAVVKTMPVIGSTGETVIGYDRVTAKGPQDCGKMPGYESEAGAYNKYGLGCSVKDMIAKQIAYPTDLKGQSDMDQPFEAGRAANIVNRDVRSGETSTFVPSYVLSELAGNTTE